MLVFAQRKDARFDVATWDAHARRFFATRLGLTEEKTYGEDDAPLEDSARLVLVGDDGAKGTRLVSARPRTEADALAADEAEARSAGWGLAALARRCHSVWIVEEEGEDDRVALRLAAILASVLLGPIVFRGSIFGVKTARERLAAPPSTSRG